MGQLPDFKDLWQAPVTQIEKFLALGAGDPDYTEDCDLVYARLLVHVAQLEAQHSILKARQVLYETKTLESWRGRIDKRTKTEKDPKGKYYSIEQAEREMVDDEVLQEFKSKDIEFKRRIGIFKAYAKAVEMKSNRTPGEQGRQNREFTEQSRTRG